VWGLLSLLEDAAGGGGGTMVSESDDWRSCSTSLAMAKGEHGTQLGIVVVRYHSKQTPVRSGLAEHTICNT
jgi:hypothetical protein